MPTVLYNGFEWDEDKAAANEAKHGVSFTEAVTVFADDFFVVKRDMTHSFAENRYLILGRSEAENYLIVVYTERRDTTRLISARRMSPNERWSYENEEE